MTDLATRPETDRVVTSDPDHRLTQPGGRGGLLEVFRSRVVVQMLVRRDVRLKYRNSSLGFFWAYVRPTIQFCVYYFIVGYVLEIERRVENFAVYVFSGLAILHFFNDTLQSSARSILRNRGIVKKVWLPREIFPVASLLVAAVRFLPNLLILMVGATVTGWYFRWEGLAAAVAGVAIIVVWGAALGLLASACMVYLRELQHMLEFVGFITHWTTPMIKPWTLMTDRLGEMGVLGGVLMAIYIWNPLCTAIELFHLAFWLPTVDFYFELSPDLWTRAWVFFVSGLVMLGFAQLIFRRMQVHFVEEL